MRYAPVILLISTGCATIASAAPLPWPPDVPPEITSRDGSTPNHPSPESSTTSNDITPRSGLDAATSALASSMSSKEPVIVAGVIGCAGLATAVAATICLKRRRDKQKAEQAAQERAQDPERGQPTQPGHDPVGAQSVRGTHSRPNSHTGTHTPDTGLGIDPLGSHLAVTGMPKPVAPPPINAMAGIVPGRGP